jgi:hypothetical protein
MSLFRGGLTQGGLFEGRLLLGGLTQEFGVVFYAPLKTTLVPLIGTYVPSFTRNTTATVTDFEGIIRTAKIGEARFEGARRVENLYANSETLATQGVSVAAGTYTVSFTGTGTITFSGAYSGSLVGTGASNRVEATFPAASAGTLTSTVSGSVLKAQCENVTGQSVQTASEYVSNGVLSSPYHGSGADGVKYFSTKLDGTPIDGSVLKGYLAEGQRTNLALYSNDFAPAAWVKSNITQSSGTLTATAANGTLLQTVTSTSKSHTFSIQIKRKTGTGAIALTLDNGATWTTKTITSAWTKYEVTQTLANPVFGVRVATSGDQIDIRYGQLETADFSSSPIFTQSASVTRNSDVLRYSFGLPPDGSAYAEVTSETDGVTYGRIVSKGDVRTVLSVSQKNNLQFYDGTSGINNSFGIYFNAGIKKVASRWSKSKLKANTANDGNVSSEGSYNGLMDGGSITSFGMHSSGGINNSLFGTMKNVKIWSRELSDVELASMTSTS